MASVQTLATFYPFFQAAITYNPESGEHKINPLHAVDPGKNKPNTIYSIYVKKSSGSGYLYFTVFGHRFPAAEVFWLMYYGTPPKGRIYFKNGITSDFRISNLADKAMRKDMASSRVVSVRVSNLNFERLNAIRVPKNKKVKSSRIHLRSPINVIMDIFFRITDNLKPETLARLKSLSLDEVCKRLDELVQSGHI